jgi:hypothetical protein
MVSATPPLALAAVANATAGDEDDGDGGEDVDAANTGGDAGGVVGSGRGGRVTCPKKMVSSTWRTGGGGVTVADAVAVIAAGNTSLATASPPADGVVLLFVLGFRFT